MPVGIFSVRAQLCRARIGRGQLRGLLSCLRRGRGVLGRGVRGVVPAGPHGLRRLVREPALGPRELRGVEMPGALPDVLSCDGSSIYLRHLRFDLDCVEQKADVPFGAGNVP